MSDGGKVISIRGDGWVAGSPSVAIVRILEAELEAARRGEIVALALASVRANQKVYTVAKCEEEAMTLLGSIEFLKRDLMSTWGN